MQGGGKNGEIDASRTPREELRNGCLGRQLISTLPGFFEFGTG